MTETNYKAKPNTRNAKNGTLETLRNGAEAAGEEVLRDNTTEEQRTHAGSVMSDSLQPHGLYGPPGFSLCGTRQARILEWVAVSSSRGSSQPKDQTMSPALTGRFFTTEPPGKLHRGDVIKQLPFQKKKTTEEGSTPRNGRDSMQSICYMSEWMNAWSQPP